MRVIELHGEPAQGDHTEKESKISQGDVVEILRQNEIDDDADEPGGNNGRSPFLLSLGCSDTVAPHEQAVLSHDGDRLCQWRAPPGPCL